ncbi:MAG: mevalonate kinase [Candidatus Bilamarchaeaceae archaeon]
MTKERSHGKIILFGEHFVVHGLPAVAAELDQYIEVEIEKSKTGKDEITFSDSAGISMPRNLEALGNIKRAVGVSEPLKMHVDMQIPIFGGLGSSAAYSAAMAKAVSALYGKRPSKDELNRISYEGEKAFHGNPSGIDNAVSVYGGVLEFTRGKTFADNRIMPVRIGKPFYLVVGVTGKFGNTKEMVAHFKEQMDKEPAKMKKLFTRMESLIKEAEGKVEQGDLEGLGKLMDENQRILEEAEMSSELNVKIHEIAKKAGAPGAKLTGGGGGGCSIALAGDQESARKIREAVKKAGFEAFITKVPAS